MSKENVQKLLALAENNETLKARIQTACNRLPPGVFDQEHLIQIIGEEVLPLAQENGLDVTMEDIASMAKTRKLTDAELDAFTGGDTAENGHWLTTIGFSCRYYNKKIGSWYGVSGTCGSCGSWAEPIFVPLTWFGVTSECTSSYH